MNKTREIKMGQMAGGWKGDVAKSITFNITEACNLACKYCYMTGKNTKNKMSFETAKKAVDYFLLNKEIFNEEAVIWDFIGGEPTLEMDLIDKISDYIKYQMYVLDHPWFYSYMFNFSTNGLLYHTPKVQEYIRKNRGHISIGISLDGNKIKHDLQRIKPDGTGSYDEVLKNVSLWQEQFPGFSTKATFAHEDLPYLKDSIISLWNNGVKTVSANVVFEDVWHEGDDIIFEKQLKELGDYILDKSLWNEYSVRFFDPNIGFPLREEELKRNFCGAGRMVTIDYQGKYYPCIRFLDFTLNNKKGLCIGDVDSGLNLDKIRPFHALTLENQSKEECIDCKIASGCAWCTGFNYDNSKTETIFERATFICKMHKANVRANEYFWEKFSQKTGLNSPREIYRKKYFGPKFLQFIKSDNITPHCNYRNWNNMNSTMSLDVLEKGLNFADKFGFEPVFLGEIKQNTDVITIDDSKSCINNKKTIVVCDNDQSLPSNFSGNSILLLNKNNINKLCSFIKNLYPSAYRVNVMLEEIDLWDKTDIDIYTQQLDTLIEFIFESYTKGNPLEVNIITDIFDLKSMSNCGAGNNTFTLAPNGKIYICPAFYFYNPNDYIGDLDNFNADSFITNNRLLDLKNSAICSACDSYQCKRCKFLNKKLTNEINTPSKIQCTLSHIERNKSRELQKKLIKYGFLDEVNLIEKVDYLDPLKKVLNQKITCNF